MGLRASMKVIPAALFKQHKDDLAELDVPKGATAFSIDAWLEIQSVLRAKPKPLKLAISGDRPIDGKLEGGLLRTSSGEADDDDTDDDDDGDDCYIGYASPTLVKKLDAALATLDESELLADIKAAGLSGKSEYRKSFAILRKAYATAAESGAAILVIIT